MLWLVHITYLYQYLLKEEIYEMKRCFSNQGCNMSDAWGLAVCTRDGHVVARHKQVRT